jgi:hypothetical protein
MMVAPVLTSADMLQCSHGGPITLVVPPTRTLRVSGHPVLVQTDLSTAVIGCTSQPPCTTIISTLSGRSQVLRVDGADVLLAGAQGATNAGTWTTLTAGSALLEA